MANEAQPIPITYKGRRRIYSRYETIDASTVTKMLEEARSVHDANRFDMEYLWKYYRGVQPILGRVKDVRPEICNRIVENHAQEIVAFKTGYQLSEPIQYVCSSSGNGEAAKQMVTLNSLMFAEDAESKNRDLFEWMCICGVGYKYVESDKLDKSHGERPNDDMGGAPFSFHVPEPWNAFVVYSRKYHHRPLAGVFVSNDEDDDYEFTVYTPKMVYTVKGGRVVGETQNGLGMIPIVEYDLNNAMMGVFESALPILDAINSLESNRLDGVEQVVQALYLFKNCQIDKDDFVEMLSLGAVSVSSTEGANGDVTLITNNLDQSQTQVMKDDLYQALIDICGMPNRNQGGANDTGSAVLLRDGWTLAESHAKSYELQFKKSEREFLRVVLYICATSGEPVKLTLRDIDLAFNRRNYDNIQTRSQAFATLAATNLVDPVDCFTMTGLCPDPSAAYLRGMKYRDEQERKAEELAERQASLTQRHGVTNVDHDGDGFAYEDNHGRRDDQTGRRVR